MSDTISTDYLVTGLTCGHCVSSVTEEVSAIDSVESVNIELVKGGASVVSVASSAPVSDEQIRAAVTEAGYTLVTS
jgi:copper chaperone